MGAYILRRVLQAIPVIVAVTFIVFSMLHLAGGDPAMILIGARQIDFNPQQLADLHHKLGLDKPFIVQYVDWLVDVLHWNFGTSFYMNRAIGPILLSRLGATALLAAGALIFAIPVGFGAGIFASLKRGTIWDRLISAVVVAGVATPSFALGLFLIVIFGVAIQLMPVAGMTTFGNGSLIDRLHHLILPAITLGMAPTAIFARIIRSEMLEVLNEDFVRVARAKGLNERVIVWRHVFRNVLVSAVTLIGLQAGFLFAGAVIVEVVFSWPGLGELIINGISQRDFPVVQAGVFVIAMVYVGFNLLADILYAVIDPRIRY